MRKLMTTLAAVAALMVAGTVANRANAMPLGDPTGVRGALDELNIVDNVQYFYGGRRWCWYDDGWMGPGWYWCGRYLVPGIGWGGGLGWRGWGGGPGIGRIGVGRVGGGVGRIGGGVGRIGGGVGRIGGGGIGGGRIGGGGIGGGRIGGGGGGRGGGGGGGRRSDMVLKHDITLLGHLDNGLGFYRFSYNGSDKAYVGVMAQEVQTVMPNAVVRGSDGTLRVFYDKLGLKFQTYDQWLASGAQVPAGTTVRH
jgi:hypothetical protein